jgi:hypothetical protein
MKESIFTLMLMFVSVFALNAQNLTGKEWFTKLSPDDGGEVFVTLTFEKNGTCEMLVATDYQIKQDGVPISVAEGVTVPGTYTLNGKDLKMDLNRSRIRLRSQGHGCQDQGHHGQRDEARIRWHEKRIQGHDAQWYAQDA